MNIHPEIISFAEIPALAEKSQRSVLLLRHSIRESLVNGNYDPGLTDEGRKYAIDCGKLLTGLKDVGFGASPRKRTIETAQALMEGGNFQALQEILPCPEIYDHSMFESPQALEQAIDNGTIPVLFRQYFSTGKAEGMKDAKLFVADLLNFLTQSEFGAKNTILCTHDIVIVTLLYFSKVRLFTPDDWCGYVQGAALFLEKDNSWRLAYTVPDAANRQPYSLFV